MDLRRLLKGPTALFLLLACVPLSHAADVYRDGADVVVNGVTVIRFKATVGTNSPTERAGYLVKSLGRISDTAPVHLEKLEEAVQVFVGDDLCLTVTKADAKAAKSTVGGLARTWARGLSSALVLPPLRLETSSLEVPNGGTRTVRLLGSLARKASLTFDTPSVATARYRSPELEIRGTQNGVSTLTIEAPGYVETLSVRVRPYAATLPQSLSAEVVGSPAGMETVAGALATAIRTQLKAPDLAKIEFQVPQTQKLPVGESRTIRVPVRVSATDCFPISGNVTVTVRNLSLAKAPDAELWYDNNPETVRQPQGLFSANLRQGAPARLLYHHANATEYPLFLRVQLINDSDQAAKVVVIPGDTPPDKNPVRAGLVAGLQYFQSWMYGSGEVVTIPPRSSMPICIRKMATGQTSSGLCGMRLLEGPSSLLLRTDAWPPFELDSRWVDAINSTTPWREVGCPPINEFDQSPYRLSEHVYPDPQKVEDVRYEVGGRYGFVRIGQRAILRQDQNSRLEGNFGVIYNIRGEVVNPTDHDTDIEVVFEASAGYTGAVFSVNGALIKAGPMPPKGERQITKFHLAAGQSRSLNMYTIPLSGSSYPATLTIRPVLKPLRTQVTKK